MSSVEIIVASLRGTHVAALVSLFGTLVFLTLVGRAAMAEAPGDTPLLRRRLLLLARCSAACALVIGMPLVAGFPPLLFVRKALNLRYLASAT